MQDVTITRPADVAHLRDMVGWIADCARAYGFAPDRVQDIELASEEALVNVLSYAYPEINGDVTVSCRFEDARRMVIQIVDNGVPFNPLISPDPALDLDLSERAVGGLGIFFLKQLADEVAYSELSGQNRLVLIFLLEGRK